MKTKIFFLVILVTFVTNALFSQDIIFMRDGSQIKGKVTEFEGNLIKYKPFDFLEGPTRSVSISDVNRIVYEGGRVENFVIVKEEKVTPPPISNPVTVSQPSSQEAQTTNYYPWAVFGRISGQSWHNSDLSEFFGTNVLYGGGIEKQILDHFIIGADFDFASKTKDEMTLAYTQFGGFVRFSWATFGTRTLLIYSQLGVRGVSFRHTEVDYSKSATGIGFSAILGLEIPLGKKVTLNLAWDSVFSNVTSEGETTNAGSEIFSGGLLFRF
jgi:opacity protein-like surface antigen